MLVCVDCGTSAVDALTRAVELGVEPIVLDHHLAGGVRPPGLMANPALGQMPDDAPAAAGVVFAVVRGPRRASGRAPGRAGPRARVRPGGPGDGGRCGTAGRSEPASGHAWPGGDAQVHTAGDPRLVSGGRHRPAHARRARARVYPRAGHQRRRTPAPPRRCARAAARGRSGAGGTIADELWALNAERREVEQAITAEAIAQIEASPTEIRDANAILAIGDGWHEGVVGIVASRLVDHFDRPALVLARDDEVAKGSGRSLPGLDLHDLLGRASGRLTRWGGHAGAVGLQLPADQVAAFRSEFLAAAASLGPVLERARIRPIDAVVGARELTLETAEAFEALAPYGRGNPQPRLLMPACTAEAAGLMGKGGATWTCACTAGGAHLRAVGFGHGHRLDELADGERVDVHVSSGIERYQGLVGPRVSIDRLEPVLQPATPAVTCAPACDLACPARVTLAQVRRRIAVALPDPVAPRPSRPPRAIEDDRGSGTALVRIAALARRRRRRRGRGGRRAAAARACSTTSCTRSASAWNWRDRRIRCATGPPGRAHGSGRAPGAASSSSTTPRSREARCPPRRTWSFSIRPRTQPGPLVARPRGRPLSPPGLDRARRSRSRASSRSSAGICDRWPSGSGAASARARLGVGRRL